jgi:tetratricopeptide (TPR) repeat protein
MSSEVEVPESLEAAEDYQEVSGRIDPEAYAQQAIADALSFRHANLHTKALEVLRIALEVVPSSVDLRAELRDVLLELGDDSGAVGEMVTLAAIAIDAGEFENALHELYRLLHVMPEHRRAREMLEQLQAIGYGVELEALPPDATDASPDETNFGQGGGQPDSVRAVMDSFDPEQPLPSYDLEEIGAGDLLSSTSEAPPAPPAELTETDDPFGDAAGALPTFALDDDPFVGEAHRHEMPTSPGEIDPGTGMLAGTRGFQGGDSLEDALEEVDFFATRGLYDDARAILDEQLSRAPNHPLLLEKLRELTDQQGDGSGARPVPERTQVTSGGGFDVGDALDALDDAFEPMPEAKEHFHRENDQVDVEAVFAKFKEGVKAQVDDDDSATHYDLGVAYKEMGLIEDSIGEFRTAATDPKKACVCLSMVGVIELERGNLDAAAAAFVEALHAEQRTMDQELSLYYELGSIYEAKENRAEALYYFQKIERKDPEFRDVGERIAALGGERPSMTGRSLSKAEDFDSVFDDMVGGGPAPPPIVRKPPPRRPGV